jgi:serine/threonine-protein kinase
VGRSADEAERRIEGLGLQTTVNDRETKDQEPGTVLEQSPAAGTQLQKGATVTLTVAKAPAQVSVPDVIDDDVDQAVAKLRAAGFSVRKRREAVDTPDDDKVVLDQNPPAGEKRDSGAEVTLVVGRFTPPNLDPDPGATPTPTP